MTRLSDYVNNAKLNELIIYSKSGKPVSRMNLVTAIVLGVILFELTIVLAVLALLGLLDVEIKPLADALDMQAVEN